MLAYRAQVVAMTTILEYVTEAYGPSAPVSLIHALDSYEDWDSLLLWVYGVDTATFESGWQEYVARQYGVDADQPTSGAVFIDALARFEADVTVSYGR
ncbi:MAG: hypothetical protein R2873_11735 [Caldilineaceae bacterium]